METKGRYEFQNGVKHNRYNGKMVFKNKSHSFVVPKYLFWNELPFLVTYDIVMNFSSWKYKSTCVL